MNIEEDLSIIDMKNDFLIRSDCFYMTDTKEIEGKLILKKNTIEFIQKLDFTLGDTGIKKLKKLDQDLFQTEITKLE
jgi:hypothetical protein